MFFFRKKKAIPRRLIILNPAASRGRGLLEFEKIKNSLRHSLTDFDLYLTRAAKDATYRVQEALRSRSHDQILVAGGDGTINEAVNGYYENGRVLNSKIPLGVIDLGSGADFIRTLRELSDGYDVAIQQNRWIRADIGQVELLPIADLRVPTGPREAKEFERTLRYLRKENQIQRRMFMNIASSGISGHIIRSLLRSPLNSGALAYFYHTMKTFATYRASEARVLYSREDKGPWAEYHGPLLNLLVCNGRYNGGGMLWAPPAYLDDGWFHCVHVARANSARMLMDTHHLYDGRIDEMEGVESFQARRVLLIPTKTLDSETDGELLPMMGLEGAPAARMLLFSVIPRILPLIL